MFVLVIMFAVLSVCQGRTSEISSKPNTPSKTYNTFTQSQKPESYYQPTTQQTPQSFPYTYASKPVYITPAPQQQAPLQPTMVIIAHPALIPQNLLNQMGIVQHMVNYFQNNPQAKYQLLYGIQQQQLQQQQRQQYPHPTAQPYVQAVPAAAYQPMTSPYQQYAVAAPTQLVQPATVQFAGSYGAQQQNQQPQVVQLDQINHLAQSVVQQYALSPNKGGSPPAIITGLENFSPEQQAHIKSQLGLVGNEQPENTQTTKSQSGKTTTSSSNSSPSPTSLPLRASYYNQ